MKKTKNPKSLEVIKKIFASRAHIINIYSWAVMQKASEDQIVEKALQEVGETVPKEEMSHFKTTLKNKYLLGAENPSNRGFLMKLQDAIEKLENRRQKVALFKKISDKDTRLEDLEEVEQLKTFVDNIKKSAAGLKQTPNGYFAAAKKLYAEEAAKQEELIKRVENDAGLCQIQAGGNVWWPTGSSSKKADPYSIQGLEEVLPNFGDIGDLSSLGDWLKGI